MMIDEDLDCVLDLRCCFQAGPLISVHAARCELLRYFALADALCELSCRPHRTGCVLVVNSASMALEPFTGRGRLPRMLQCNRNAFEAAISPITYCVDQGQCRHQ